MKDGLSMIGVAALAVTCCAGLPLLIAAGVTAGAIAWIGGVALGAGVFAAFGVIAIRRWRQSPTCHSPEQPDVEASPRGERRVGDGVRSR